MKKIKKIMAGIMAAAMIASVGGMSVSAKTYVEVDENGYPTEVVEALEYRGIVVTMPDDIAPTVDEIGIECDIEGYDAESFVIGYKDCSNSGGWLITPTVQQKENQFYLDFGDGISEDKAIEISEKLIIRGVVQDAEVLYDYHISYGKMKIFDCQHQVSLVFKEGTDISEVDVLEEYPEIREMLSGYSSFKAENYAEESILYFGLTDSEYANNQSSPYSDILALEEVLVSKYEEIDRINIWFLHMVGDDNSQNAVYAISPTWGDATNDDIIDLYDAIEISKHIMGIGEFDEDTILLADINRDGVTNLYDAVEIAKGLM